MQRAMDAIKPVDAGTGCDAGGRDGCAVCPGERASEAGYHLDQGQDRVCQISVDLTDGYWASWCGSRRTVRLAVGLGRATTLARFGVLLVCLLPTPRSRLSAAR